MERGAQMRVSAVVSWNGKGKGGETGASGGRAVEGTHSPAWVLTCCVKDGLTSEEVQSKVATLLRVPKYTTRLQDRWEP